MAVAQLDKAIDSYETALTAKLNRFEVSITRFDAAEVAAEVEHARELEKQMAKEAREKMREEMVFVSHQLVYITYHGYNVVI